MTSSFYVRLMLVVAVIVLAVVFVVAIARADYPNGFARVHELCSMSPELQPGLKGVELYIPDTYNEDNPDGKIMLVAGEGDRGIGIGIAVFDKAEMPLLYVAIYHMTDETTVVVNILTGEEDTIGDVTVQDFINQWFTLYNKAVGIDA